MNYHLHNVRLWLMAARLAWKCRYAYPMSAYRSVFDVARKLTFYGLFSEDECEAIMCSKWARYAADQSEYSWGNVPSWDLVAWLVLNADLDDGLKQLVADHFEDHTIYVRD